MTGQTDVTQEIAAIMVGLAEAYGVKLTEGRIRAYGSALADLPPDRIRQSAARAVRESTFFPTVAELRRGVEPSPDDAALIAWTALERAAADVGAYASLHIEDPASAVALVSVFGGWPEFCEQCGTDGGWPSRRSEFLAAYRQARRATVLDAPARVQGLCERAGRYDPQKSWVGRIGARGEVLGERDLALGPAAERKRLPGKGSGE